MRTVYDESLVTAELDEMVEGRSLEAWAEESATISTTGIAANAASLLDRIAVELHRARRFYERPESQGSYRERPDPSAVPQLVESPQPEFHERVGMVGDHPALLRRLGLVVNLRADVARLRESRFLTGRIIVDSDPSASRDTQVLCRTTPDDGFVAVPDTSDWRDGALALGDEERFVVLDTDTDGSAIKSERYLWTLPRLAKSQANDDPVHAATPAIRASGFTVARTGQALTAKQRLDRQAALQNDVRAATTSRLNAEDVIRGMRVEVWDDTVRRWFSLHERLTDAVVDNHGTVLHDVRDVGFIQGTAAHETPGVTDSPVHVHEAMFGWEGWSLSAPRPGKRLRKATPEEVAATGEDEIVEETPDHPVGVEDPPHPIRFRHKVRPGTLPRLRFGRSYAFRAWAVDLAGNSRPHGLNPPPVVTGPAVGSALGSVPRPQLGDSASLWSPAIRNVTHSRISERMLEQPKPVTPAPLPEPLRTVVSGRIRSATAITPLSGHGVTRGAVADRRRLVQEAAAAAVANPEQPIVSDTAVTAVESVADLAAAHLSATLAPGAVTSGLAELAVNRLATVTRLRPFLRWDPIQPPAVVPRRVFTEGESVRVLVIRSGVTQDPDNLTVTVKGPQGYAASVPAERHYSATSERHLPPPKTTQMTAELHGMFDPGIGTTEAQAQQMLGWAISEDGSFLDETRADLDNAPARIAQPGVSLQHSAETPQAELKQLPLASGEAPAPGQYVVHDTDDLTLPYLPDPMAEGVSFVFPEAGRDRSLPFPFGGEGFTAAYSGTWPRTEPYRMVLTGGKELGGRIKDREITFRLPPGDVQRMRLSSSLDRDGLDLLGVWRSMPPLLRDNPDLREAAADGWLWGLTPSDDVMLVHAVPRPIEAPDPTPLVTVRAKGATDATVFGGVDLHGPSTDNLVCEASWTDPFDDLMRPRWEDRPSSAVAFQTPIQPTEDLALLGFADLPLPQPGASHLRLHRAVQEFGDTKHRLVSYRFRALSRFREYFHPSLLTSAYPGDDGQSTISEEVVVDVPSTAVPAAPVLHSVIPLLRWEYGEEPEQPMARRHVRRTGVRIYLERPWFTSGEGELLAVLLATPAGDAFGAGPDDDSGFPFVSKVGQDPVWLSAPVATRPMLPLQLDTMLRYLGLDAEVLAGRPVTKPERLPLATVGGSPEVMAVGYRPQFNEERGLWYVDVALDPGATFWPFVRLAVARYQPSSVDGCHLSAPVLCDYVQLTPERTVSVSRTDESHVRVVVSGSVGMRGVSNTIAGPTGFAGLAAQVTQNRIVVARLQKRDPDIHTDLGWSTVATEQLRIRGTGANNAEAAWVGELAASKEVPMRRPLDPGKDPAAAAAGTWRVTVEEWERLPGDELAPREQRAVPRPTPKWEQRLVFADEILL